MNRRVQEAFTRCELLVVIASAGVLGALAFSVLGSSGARTEMAVCANNLRQVGRAFNMWASDHQNAKPWWLPYSDGGSLVPGSEPTPATINVPGLGPQPAALRNNAWMQFAFIHEELPSPGVLVCPADRDKRRALDFSRDSSSGYLSVNFRDRATSYFIGLHAFEPFPSALLSGDRTIQEAAANTFCSANVGTTHLIQRSGPYGWWPDLHGAAGNLLLNDGSVQELSDAGLAQYQQSRLIGPPTSGNDHILKP